MPKHKEKSSKESQPAEDENIKMPPEIQEKKSEGPEQQVEEQKEQEVSKEHVSEDKPQETHSKNPSSAAKDEEEEQEDDLEVSLHELSQI